MVCQAFNCPPDVAERQELPLVVGVLDARAAREALRLFNDGKRGAAELGKRPDLQRLLLDLVRAQGATNATWESVIATAPPGDEDGSGG